THVVVERETAKPLPDFIRRPFAEIRDEVGRIGRASTVSENEDLPVFFEGFLEKRDKLIDPFNRDRIQSRLLLRNVIGNPVFHGESLSSATPTPQVSFDSLLCRRQLHSGLNFPFRA